MDKEIMKCYITLINSEIRDYGKAANDFTTYVCDKMYEMHIPFVGFILKKDSGIYIVVGEDFAQELAKFWHNPCISFDIVDYMYTAQEPLWLVEYEDNDPDRPKLMYYFK